ncbi:MAG: isoleucine--tRNA ligase [Planctomycetales bacterium]|nr:isoleucine--tRNA ligase [bacterium]UNM06853.1 MAG: isoleucine--tRNA ligase [Planctomycetales bacterium]
MSSKRQSRFEKVDTSYNFPAMEQSIQSFWEDQRIFQQSLEKDAPQGSFVFYEGPPTANSLPHPGHVLTRVIKDCLPRFRTMQGYYVRRQAGWDTHGLPVELSVEKELIESGEMTESGPQAILNYGMEKFNRRCFESVRRYEAEWVKLSNRIGFWLDYDNAYFTFTNKYVESVWNLLKQIHDRGLMYKGYKIQWYSTLVGTGLSSHEVAQNWQTVKDPSVTVRAHVPRGTRIGDFSAGDNTYLLLWTTTPWTLLSNVALCVHPDYEYVVVSMYNKAREVQEHLVLAEGLLAKNGLESEPIVARVKGSELAGLAYERLFAYDVPNIRRYSPGELEESGVRPAPQGNESDNESIVRQLREQSMKNGWHVLADTYVTLEDGTGIVHLAPAFGEDDYRIGLRENLPILCAMNSEGRAVEGVKLAPGKWFKDVDPDVITDLKKRGLLFKSQKYAHNYPHCYRTDAPLMSYPLDSWFIRMPELQQELIDNNQKIRWQPEHIRDGRFGNWLEDVKDWSLSRDRFWGTPLPVWTCSSCGHQECLGSYAELQERCPDRFANVTDVYDQSQFNPHRPYIDDFTWECSECGKGTKERERYILDPWFDAGSMPFAQIHYPFENRELIDGDGQHRQFPADFISEAVDQTRGWFYTLHAISTIIKGEPSYKSCLVLGHILDEKGQKMSKRLGNVVDPWKVINSHGADAFRWYFYSSGNLFSGARFSDSGVVESLQRFIIPLWNVYSFFTIYANIDEYDPNAHSVPWEELSDLDRWITIKLNRCIDNVTRHLDNLELTQAAAQFEELVEATTNWYVRRSRRRFWQGEKNTEKWAAYQTLYNLLCTLSRAVAPFTPFLAEELYQKLVLPFNDDAPQSVHLDSYPVADMELADDELEFSMDQVRRSVSLGHAARKASGVRVRQPLSRATLITHDEDLKPAIERYLGIMHEELNIKQLEWAEDETEYVSYSYKPAFRQLGPLFGKSAKDVANWIAGNAAEITAQLEAHRDFPREALDRSGQMLNWVEFELGGETFVIDESCFEVHLEQKPDTVCERDGNLLLVLDTQISDELRKEGLAREVVNRLQGQRKTLDLDYQDRIKVVYSSTDEVAAALEVHRDYVMQETLADSLERGEPAGTALETEVDGMDFRYSVSRS